MQYEYLCQKLPLGNIRKATEILNVLGAKGWHVEYITHISSDLICVMSKEIKAANPSSVKKRTAKVKSE